MKKQLKKFVSRNLEKIAKVSASGASTLCFYEPKVPKQLMENSENTKTDKKER